MSNQRSPSAADLQRLLQGNPEYQRIMGITDRGIYATPEIRRSLEFNKFLNSQDPLAQQIKQLNLHIGPDQPNAFAINGNGGMEVHNNYGHPTAMRNIGLAAIAGATGGTALLAGGAGGGAGAGAGLSGVEGGGFGLPASTVAALPGGAGIPGALGSTATVAGAGTLPAGLSSGTSAAGGGGSVASGGGGGIMNGLKDYLLGGNGHRGVDPTSLILGGLSMLGGNGAPDPYKGSTTNPEATLSSALAETHALMNKLTSRGPARLRAPEPVTIAGLPFQIGGGLGDARGMVPSPYELGDNPFATANLGPSRPRNGAPSSGTSKRRDGDY